MFYLRSLPLVIFCAGFQVTTLAAAQSEPLPEQTEELLSKAAHAEDKGMFIDALGEYEAASRLTPGQAGIFLRMGLLKGKSGDFEGAKDAFAHAIELDPKLAEAHYDLGLALLGGSKQVPLWKEALEHFNAARMLRHNYAEATNMAGVCLLETGNPTQAAELFREALKSKTNAAGMHFNLGRALESLDQKDEALKEYTEAAIERRPYPEAELAIGNLLYAQANYPQAVVHLTTSLAANPEQQEAYYKLSKTLRALGKPREAQAALKVASSLIQSKSDAVMSTHLSNESLNHAKSGDIAGGIQLLRKALWLDPTNAIANYNLGLLLADTGNFEAAILEMRKAISLAPTRAEFYVSLAEIQSKAGDNADAEQTLTRAIQLKPSDQGLASRLSALKTAASAHAHSGSLKEPASPYGAASDSADGHMTFAQQLSREGDLLGTVGELLRAAALRPDRSDIRMNLAIARAQLGQTDAAEMDFRKALLQAPSNADAHVALGSLLLSKSRNNEAADEFRQALAIQPADAKAAQLLKLSDIGQHP